MVPTHQTCTARDLYRPFRYELDAVFTIICQDILGLKVDCPTIIALKENAICDLLTLVRIPDQIIRQLTYTLEDKDATPVQLSLGASLNLTVFNEWYIYLCEQHEGKLPTPAEIAMKDLLLAQHRTEQTKIAIFTKY